MAHPNRMFLRPGVLWLTLNLALIIQCLSWNSLFILYFTYPRGYAYPRLNTTDLEGPAWAAAVSVTFTVAVKEVFYSRCPCLTAMPRHSSLVTRNALNNTNRKRCVGGGEPATWPPRSPDLNTRSLNVLTHFQNSCFFISAEQYRNPSTVHCERLSH
jgi:hypothetical protein